MRRRRSGVGVHALRLGHGLRRLWGATFLPFVATSATTVTTVTTSYPWNLHEYLPVREP